MVSAAMDEEVEVKLPSHARYRSLSLDRSLSSLSALPQTDDAAGTTQQGNSNGVSLSLRGAKRRGNLHRSA
jgi:hypothetical protein